MRSFLSGLFFFFSFLFTAQSQRLCGTTEYSNHLQITDPTFNKGLQKATNKINQKNTASATLRDTTANEVIYIPVVIHLLYKTAYENISDAQIKSQINVLNNDFRRLNDDKVNTPLAFKSVAADTRIQFCLARVDPQGKSTNGIDRRYTNRDFFTTDDEMKFVATGGAAYWDSKQYLNIWVVKLSGRSLAYATPPGASADKDGLVIAFDVFGNIEKVRPVFNKGRTATHEIGHWLGLTHTWGDTNCGDDFVDDTPTQQSYNFGCPVFPKMSTCSPDNNGDMFMNFMDFSDDACMNLFTKGQAKKMRGLFAQGNIRNSFLSSFVCDSSAAQGGPLPDTTKPVTQPVANLTETKVYPNPVQSILNINCKSATGISPKTMRIFNSIGISVYTIQLNQQKTTHNLGNLAGGIYIIKITDGKDSFTSKVIKL